jgi:phosphinothricin acetyltransferase
LSRTRIASVALHTAAGCEHGGRLAGAGFKHDRRCDTVLMQLPMNGGGDTLPA